MLFASEVKTITCICCPCGCPIEVTFDDEGAVEDIVGYTCNRGKVYAQQEATDPVRMVTAVVCAKGCLEPLSVKTAAPVPKEAIADVLRAIAALDVSAPIELGQTVLSDAAGTGIDVIATKQLP